MLRDPFYAEIVTRLGTRLDPELFERCAAALLRTIYPGLVPIRGGNDSGMDGAMADGEGRPFPLIATTSSDVLGNLSRSLMSYLADGGSRRKAVLATSQSLSPKRRRNLEERAEQLGVALIQIHDQASLADLLYHNPDWCLELLNLTGRPSALSAIPLGKRSSLEIALVGREGELGWLQAGSSDRLLVGQPGSGKTFLLERLARDGDGRALFIVSSDLGDIATAIRRLRPGTLFVDDAQMDLELLAKLKHLRGELNASFRIVATCWPSHSEEVTRALDLPSIGVQTLGLLTRDQIVEVVRAAGISGPNQLIRMIVDQAEGRPGLAAYLAQVCLQSEIGLAGIISGDALRLAFTEFFNLNADARHEAILAACAVGGDGGMSIEVVASLLGLTVLDVRTALVRLSTGGVVRDLDRGRVSVRPAALRHALISRVYFGRMRLPVEPVLAAARSVDAALTLVGARAAGASVPQDLLIDLLESARSERAWEAYTWLGTPEATWVLDRHPEMLNAVARAALQNAPSVAVPLLLAAAVGDGRRLNSSPEHPLRLLEDWVAAIAGGKERRVERRAALVQAALSWLGSTGDASVGLHAVRFALAPKIESATLDPGAGRTLTIRFGGVPAEEVAAIERLWRTVRVSLPWDRIGDFGPLVELLEDWAYPRRDAIDVPPESKVQAASLAETMLRDLTELTAEHPGIQHRLSGIASDLQVDLSATLSDAFEILYPFFESEQEATGTGESAVAAVRRLAYGTGESAVAAVRRLAQVWCTEQVAIVARQIAMYEREAQAANLTWPRMTGVLCQEIAEKVISPLEWARELICAGCGGDVVLPFLQRAAQTAEPGWEQALSRWVEVRACRYDCLSLALTLPDPPPDVLAKILTELDGAERLVRDLCMENKVPTATLRHLLASADHEIAEAAVIGEWHARGRSSVRDEIRLEWRAAVLRVVSNDIQFGRVLGADPVLALEWLLRRFGAGFPQLLLCRETIEMAVGALETEGRRQLLERVPDSAEMAFLVKCAVGEDLELYRSLLATRRQKALHLAPLAGTLEGVWPEKALLALGAGYSPEEVALSALGCCGQVECTFGDESNYWEAWANRYSKLESHDDSEVRRIGAVGRTYAEQQRAKALSEEHKEAVFGIPWL
jgi:hypothetical protein